jgi:glycosyltransferase involved in cell wall biosynthesis
MNYKVCFIGGTRYSWPLNHTQEKKFRELSAARELFVIAFSSNHFPRSFKQYAHFYLLPNLPTAVLRYGLMFTIGSLLAVWLCLARGARIFVAQSPYEGFAGALAKALLRAIGKKTVLIVENHGDFEEALFLQRRVPLSWLYRSLMHRIARWSLKRADLLRAISSTTRQQLERWVGDKRGRVVQFPTYTDIEKFLEASKGIKENKIYILYVGVLTPLKGIHLLIRAFVQIASKLPDVSLKIIGRAENPAYAKALRELVAQNGLVERVSFLEEMPQEELVRHMCSCCVLVLPSVSEGLGRVLIEAMACGKPVIASRVGGIPEVVQDGVTGFLITPGDVNTLAEKLLWLLTHPREARVMGERGREFAKNFFSTQEYIRRYEELFTKAEQLLKGEAQ